MKDLFIQHWSTLALIILSLTIVFYDVIAKFTNWYSVIDKELKIDLVLVILVGYITESAIGRMKLKNTVDYLAAKTKRKTNSFVENISEYITQLDSGLNTGRLIFYNRQDSLSAMFRLMESARISYQGLNYYESGWQTIMKEFLEANVSAVHRGINVKRYFVLREHISVVQEKHLLLSTMQKHHDNGIKLFFIFEKDLKKIKFFRNFSIRGMGIYDGNIVSYDAAPTGTQEGPTEIIISWIWEEVLQKNPFPHLEKSGLLKSYPSDIKILDSWIIETE